MDWILFLDALLLLIYAVLIAAVVVVAIFVKTYKSCNPGFVSVYLVLSLLLCFIELCLMMSS